MSTSYPKSTLLQAAPISGAATIHLPLAKTGLSRNLAQYLLKVSLLMLLAVSGLKGWGQFSISATGVVNTHTQNFNSFVGTSATLPANWALGGTISTYNTTTPLITAGTTTFTQASGNLWCAARPNGSSTDNAIVMKHSTSGSSTLTFSVTNGTGSPITGFVIGWNSEQYTTANRATTLNFSYRLGAATFGTTGLTGTTLTTATTGADAVVAANAVISNSRSIVISGISLAAAGTADFRFTIANGGTSGSNVQIGIDDFTIYATGAAPATPTTTSLSPSSATAGSAGFDLTVNGTNFISGSSTVTWGGSNRTTTFVSSTQLTAAIPGTDIASAGSATVGVTTTGAAASSNTQTFTITSAGVTPTKLAITSISPTSPVQNSTFNVTVQAQDVSNAAGNVTANTAFSLTNTGGGAIGGTTTGTITAGANSTTVTGVTLSGNGTGITLTATQTSGDVLTAGTSSGFTVLASVPTVASTVVASNRTATTLDLTWASGGGARRIVVARLNATTAIPPTTGAIYSPSATSSFSGTTVTGLNNIVVFDGTGNTVSITNLSAATAYAFDVYEYNGTTSTANYAAAATSGSISTLSALPTGQASNITFGTFLSTGLGYTIGFTAGTGSTGRIVVVRQAGAVDFVPVGGTTYTANTVFTSGTGLGTSSDNKVVFAGSGTSVAVTGLTANTVYNVAVYEYNGTGASINYLTSLPATGSRTTVAVAPTTQPTGFTRSAVTTTGMTLSWTAASSGAAGYIVLRATASGTTYPSTVPVNGTIYTVGSTLGNATVEYVGSNLSAAVNSTLASNTQYSFSIFSYNGTGAAISYFTTSPLQGQPFTLATEPTVAPTSIVVSNLAATTATITVTGQNGAGVAVFIKSTTAVDFTPTDGISYTSGENAAFGSGTQFGTGNYLVLLSATSPFTVNVTGLTGATLYNIGVYTYNGLNSNASNNFLPTAGTNTFTTLVAAPSAQPTALTFGSVTINSFTLGFTAATGNPAGYLVLRNTGSAPTGTPANGTTYTAGTNNIGGGTNTVVYAGVTPSPNIAQTSLTDGTNYFYSVYSYNGSGSSITYLTTSPLTGSQATPSVSAPIANAATDITNTSFTANWTAVTGASGGYLLDVATSNTFGSTQAILTEGFENSLTNFTETTGTGTYYTGNSAAGDNPGSSPLASSGTYGYGKQLGSVTITSNTINTSAYSNIQLSFKLAAFSNPTGNGLDGGDIVTVSVSPDGGTTYYSTVRVLGNSNAVWAFNATGNANTVYDGNISPVDFQAASSGLNAAGFSTVTVTGLPSVSNLRIRITMLNDNAAERWVIDNLLLSGFQNDNLTNYNGLAVAGLSQVVSGLSANTPYFYRVRAVGANSTSVNSGTVTATTNTLVTITPSLSQSKVFGSSDPVFTYSSNVASLTFTGALSRSSGESIGTYSYSLGDLSAGSGYTLLLGGSNTFAITAIPITNANFRSNGDVNFNSASNWQYDQGGNSWVTAGAVPTASNNVTISNGDSATLDVDFTVGAGKSLVLEATSKLVINPTSRLEMTDINSIINFGGESVTLKSTADGTGSIGKITGTLSGATNVTVERYIPAHTSRAWRLLSVPTRGAQTIRQAWQELGDGDFGNTNLNSGFGTLITTPYASPTANGFDKASVANSLLKYDNVKWNGITSTYDTIGTRNTDIATSKAYFLYVRGDRTQGTTGSLTDVSPTTLRTKGELYQGAINSPKIKPDSFAVIGNIYPSRIDFTQLIRTGGVDNIYYIWDAKKIDGVNLGVYQTFSLTGSWTPTIEGGSFSTSSPYNNIEQGQAFFVHNTGAEGTVGFTEAAKVAGSSNNGFRPATPAASLVSFTSNLYTAGTSAYMADANKVVFDDQYSNVVDGHDALKMTNAGENFAISQQNKNLAIEGRQPITVKDTIFYNMWNLQKRNYQLELKSANLNAPGLTAILQDAHTGNNTVLNLGISNTINFTVDATASSSAANRFRVVFKQVAFAPLPVSFISVSASRSATGNAITWKVAAESNMAQYEVERSADGRSFAKTGTVTANAQSTYSFTDAQALSGTVFYRIKGIGLAGEVKYSAIVKLTAGNIKPGYSVSPNPSEGNMVNLQFKNQAAGNYHISISTIIGQRLFTNVVAHPGGSSTQVLNITERLAAGTYQLEIIAPDKSRQTQSLVVKSND